jgi:acetolactate synthase small subunit
MVVKRLGGEMVFVSAADNQVTLVTNVATERSHRIAPQLRRIVDVTEVLVLQNTRKMLIA